MSLIKSGKLEKEPAYNEVKNGAIRSNIYYQFLAEANKKSRSVWNDINIYEFYWKDFYHSDILSIENLITEIK